MNEKILLIDDSKSLCELLTLHLEDEFNIDVAYTGSDGLNMFINNDYDVVLLDINLPDIDGFQVFESMASINDHKNASVIFISTCDDDETVIRCYEIGAADFISKQHEVKALVQRIKSLVRFRSLVKGMKKNEQKLSSLVDTTMMQASFYGSCLNLMADIQLANQVDTIADMVFGFMQSQGLNVALSFRYQQSASYFDQQTQVCSPIEKNVFELLKDKGRIYHFAQRVMFNDKHCSMLVKNMPASDTMEYGLLIDVLAKLLPAIEVKYQALLNSRHLEQAQKAMQQAVSKIQMAVVDLQNDKQKLIDDIVMKIGLSFHQLDFTLDQEAFLVELIESSVTTQTSNNDKFIEVNKKLEQTVASLATSEVKYQTEEQSVDVELF